MTLVKDFSFSAVVAGFVTSLVGFTGAGVIFFQAAQALGASSTEIGSWMWALGLGMGIPGIALFGTIGKGLATALKEEGDREAALITFLVTASGVTLLGIGAAFWGLLAGAIASAVPRFIWGR